MPWQQKGKKKNHPHWQFQHEDTQDHKCFVLLQIIDWRRVQIPVLSSSCWGALGRATRPPHRSTGQHQAGHTSPAPLLLLTETSTRLDGQHKGSVSTLLVASWSHKKQSAANTAANLEDKHSFQRGDQTRGLLLDSCAGSRRFVLTARTLIKSGSWKDVVRLRKPTIWPWSYTVGT